MFEGLVSWFLDFFNDNVSVDVFGSVIVEFYVLGPFIWYIFLFCSSNIRSPLDLYIPWENEKSLRLSGFYLDFSPLIFFKIVFLENYDRYEAETFRVY